ncbi:pur operon repressor [Aerococcaceae bacterium WGS1372]
MINNNFKPKRNHRMLYISHYLVDRPGQLINLSYFVDFLNAAKSSISEDIDFVRQVFDMNGLGEVKTFPGANGGIIFYPKVPMEEQKELLNTLIEKFTNGKRILQGNYIYTSDILQDSFMLSKVGRLIASHFVHKDIDAVMTVESKGIGLATIVARYLNVPYVTARRDSTDAIGPTISVNYVAGSMQTVRKMELEKNSLKTHQRVLIVDDFLRNGGTAQGMISLLEEFECTPVGIAVLGENSSRETEALKLPIDSLVSLQLVYNKDERRYELDVQAGSLFNEVDFN